MGGAPRNLAAASFGVLIVMIGLTSAPASAAPTTTISFGFVTNGDAGAEPALVNGEVATFQDSAHTTPTASDYAATLNWGDATSFSTAAGTLSILCPDPDASNECDLLATAEAGQQHFYTDEGSYTVTATVYPAGSSPTSSDAATDTGTLTVDEGDNLAAGSSFSIQLDGAHSYNGTVAKFTDTAYPSNSASDFTATINWGDGGLQSGIVSNDGSGHITVSESHTYSSGGPFTVTTTISDDSPGTSTATTSNTAGGIEITDVTTGPVIEATVYGGEAATFTDGANPTPNAAEYGATFNWGDGNVYSPSDGNASIVCGDMVAGQCELNVSGHAYTDEGSYTVTATIYPSGSSPTGPDAVTDSGTLTAGELDNLAAGSAVPIHLDSSHSYDGAVAKFTDTGYASNSASDFTATIDWGDATTTSGTVATDGSGHITVSGSHTYASGGPFTVTTTISDDSPGTSTATASNTSGMISVSSVAGGSVSEGTSDSGRVAVFTDTSNSSPSSSDYGATVNLGNGTTQSTSASTASIVCGDVSAGQCEVIASTHSYSDEGSYLVTVTIYPAGSTSSGPGAVSNTGTETVVESDTLSAGSPVTVNALAGHVFTGKVATFSDSGYPTNIPSDFTATINWGDSTTTSGTVTGGSGTFSVSGTHTYAVGGNYATSVTLRDDAPGTASAVANGTARVFAPAVNLFAQAGNHEVTLRWSAPVPPAGAKITGYRILRGTSPGGETSLATIGLKLSYVDGSAVNGTTYYYEVKTVYSGGTISAASNEVLATPLGKIASVLYASPSGTDPSNSCASQAHPCKTLAYASTEAAPGATIFLSSGTFGGPVIVDESLTISGAGSSHTTISGGGPVITILSGSVALIGLSVSGGNTTGNGGGIYNDGILNLQKCVVSTNTASGGGGGIYNVDLLTLSSSTVTSNHAGGNGGGVDNVAGSFTMLGGSVTGNSAGATGGGVHNTAAFVPGGSPPPNITGNSPNNVA